MIHHRSRAGFTMLEVAIASAILAAVIAMTLTLLTSSSRTASSQQAMATLEEDLRRTLDEITRELRRSGGTFTLSSPTANGDPYYDSSVAGTNMAHHGSLEFGSNHGFAVTGKGNTGAAIYDQRILRYWWEADPSDPEDGVDNNRNGLIDEGVVRFHLREIDLPHFKATNAVKWIDSTTTICRNVSRKGLTFQFPTNDNPPRSVTVNLQLQAVDPEQIDPVTKRALIHTRQATARAGPRS